MKTVIFLFLDLGDLSTVELLNYSSLVGLWFLSLKENSG
jgi:hypothetical protein